jgi:transposase
VPSVEDEYSRDLVRSIEDIRGDLMRARHRLGKFLLRRGHRYEGGGTWTGMHMRWLRAPSFEEACSQACFVDYLAAVELLVGRRQTLIDALEQQIPNSSHAQVIARLRASAGSTRSPRPASITLDLPLVPPRQRPSRDRQQHLRRRPGLTNAPPYQWTT